MNFLKTKIISLQERSSDYSGIFNRLGAGAGGNRSSGVKFIFKVVLRHCTFTHTCTAVKAVIIKCPEIVSC